MASPVAKLDAAIVPTGPRQMGRSQLVRWEKADLVIEDLFQRYMLRLEAGLRRIDTYRSWLMWKLAQKRRPLFEQQCKVKLAALLLPQTKRVSGVQPILTRNWPDLKISRGKRHGQLAWHRRKGRPPFSVTKWTEKFLERRYKRRTGKPPGRPRKDGQPARPSKHRKLWPVPLPPPTKTKRPTEGRPLGSGEMKKSKKPRGALTDTTAIDAALEDFHRALDAADISGFNISTALDVSNLRETSET